MRSLLLLILAALPGSTLAVAAPCDQLFSASSGKFSLSGGNCTALLLPPWFYAASAPIGALEAPGGVAVAKVLGADGAVTCSGALVAPRMVLTASQCFENAKEVVVGDERFRVEQVQTHPVLRGMPEGLALLRLTGSSNLAPVRIDTGESIEESCRPDGKGLTVSLANSSGAGGWLPMEFSKGGECGAAGEMYSRGSKLLCGAAGGDEAFLLGTPLIAGPHTQKDALLVGILTKTSQNTLLLSRVSAQAQWILAVTQNAEEQVGGGSNASSHNTSHNTSYGGAVFPARKLVLDVTSFDPGSSEGTVRVFGGASFSAPPQAVALQGGSAVGAADDGGSGAMLLSFSGGLAGSGVLTAAWRDVGCADNFLSRGEPGAGSCENPALGGIRGCQYSCEEEAAGGGCAREACSDPGCHGNFSQKEVIHLLTLGRAFSGGLGGRAIQNGNADYRVWMCVQGWDAEQQRLCNLGPDELGCFFFEKHSERWDYFGSNRELHLVSDKTKRRVTQEKSALLSTFDEVLFKLCTHSSCACQDGTKGLQCALCPPGTWCAGGVQFECPSHTWSLEGSAAASDCSCNPGYRRDLAPLTSCARCPEDSWCDAAGEHACPAGASALPGSSLAIHCISPPSTPAPSSPPSTQAPATSVEQQSTTTPAPAVCPAGYGGAGCAICPAGTSKASEGNSECVPCGAGTFQAGAGGTGPQCTPCPHNASSVAGATTCFCDAGYAKPAGSAICTMCPAGSYAPAGSAECTTCPANSESAAGAADSAAACTCLVGYGGNPCTICPAGTSKSAGSGECVPCGAGSFQPGVGEEQCTLCPPDTYSTTVGSDSDSVCLACPDGFGTNGTSGGSVLGNCTLGLCPKLFSSSMAHHHCVKTSTHGLKCWGNNIYGQLGDGTTTNSNTPVDVGGLVGNVVGFALGCFHSCAFMDQAGSVMCWGSNTQGQHGPGSVGNGISDGVSDDPHPDPVALTLTGTVVGITSGCHAVCALMANGDVQCWGSNSKGQFGDGTTVETSTVVTIPGIGPAAAVYAGEFHVCAKLIDGSGMCWGSGGNGEMSTGGYVDINIPGTITLTAANSGGSVVAMALGGTHTCALMATGAIQCSGKNDLGQAGSGVFAPYALSPVDVAGLGGKAVAIAAGSSHTCAIMDTGSVKCWGSNAYGQLGDSTTTDANTPQEISVLALGGVAVAIGLGKQNSCATLVDGLVKCWGLNGALPTATSLGNGLDVDSSTPVDVYGAGDVASDSFFDVACLPCRAGTFDEASGCSPP